MVGERKREREMKQKIMCVIKWGLVQELTEETMTKIDIPGDMDEITPQEILKQQGIPRNKNRMNKKLVP